MGTNDNLARIDANNQDDLDQWSKRFEATPDELRVAIRAVGPVAHAVEQYLRGTRRKSPH